MNWIRQDKRLAIYLRDKCLCVYCGADIMHPDITATLDHVTPDVQGGSNHESNLVTCCKPCNDSKNGRDVEVFVIDRLGRRKLNAVLTRILRQTQLDLTPYRVKAKQMLAKPD